MRTQSYAATRRGVSSSTNGWSRNYNMVRHQPKSLGSVAMAVIVGFLVVCVGMIYVSQGTQAMNYDYELSAIENEITELEAKREDLAVEKARLTSVASSERSSVAAAMEGASVGGYAE